MKSRKKWSEELELTVDDVRSMVGSYVLELVGKDKEIAQLKAEVEQLRNELGKDKKSHEPERKEIANFGNARSGN